MIMKVSTDCGKLRLSASPGMKSSYIQGRREHPIVKVDSPYAFQWRSSYHYYIGNINTKQLLNFSVDELSKTII